MKSSSSSILIKPFAVQCPWKPLDVSGFWKHECSTILIEQGHLSLKKIQTVKEYKFHLAWIVLLLCYCLYYQECYFKYLLRYIMFQCNILISYSLPSSGQRSSLLSDPDTSGRIIAHKQVSLLLKKLIFWVLLLCSWDLFSLSVLRWENITFWCYLLYASAKLKEF